MDDDNEHDMIEDSEEAILITILVIILAKMNRLRRKALPYNDLPFSGANYTAAIWGGNPRRCVSVFRIPASTFLFISKRLLELEVEPISNRLMIEEQLAIFLYIVGHNNTNRQAQDRFQHSGETISSPPVNRTHGHIKSNPKFSPFFDQCLGALDGVHIPADKFRLE
ncbi:hypothetical protein PTTG_25090 [Puccinia triticina 1-1 BBBD Race 1]|uniref:DUF8040 domain-containing protein n=1 Tax=Puccinia triticina (isolate 1-1 / race 1 (BBBD)) TaxID=630390 RepID=A0A180H5P3_PUCT1|nr:hypothetical protein PTTG_25090 [Puccinia triticina 1-1 BBBD Race 1]